MFPISTGWRRVCKSLWIWRMTKVALPHRHWTKWRVQWWSATKWHRICRHSSLGHELRKGHRHLVWEATEVLVLKRLLELVGSWATEVLVLKLPRELVGSCATEALVLKLLLELVGSCEEVLHDVGSEYGSIYPHVWMMRLWKSTRPNIIRLLW